MPSHLEESSLHSHHHENIKYCTISDKLNVTLNIKGSYKLLNKKGHKMNKITVLHCINP